ncbi:MAG: UbiA family prenyltransferase [Calditrichaeota bacterium]|nr:UbiA family prenyltransferase [Calditrichota bacterium]
MGSFLRVLDYVFVLRPTLFVAVWTVFLAGRWAQLRFLPVAYEVPWWRIWLFGAAVSAVMGAVFVVNQLQDVETDLANNKLYLIARGEIRRRTANLEAYALLALGLLLALWLDVTLFVILGLLFFVGGVAYSYRPWLWKNRPFFGLFSNAFGALFVFLAGWGVGNAWHPVAFQYAIPYILAVVSVYFLTTIPDEPGDRASGKITFVVAYGDKATRTWALAAVAFSVVAGAFNRDLVILFPAVASLPLFAVAASRGARDDVLRATKMSILLLSLTVCIAYPGYLLLLVLVFGASKWYYKKRFGLNYPSLET